MGSQSKIQSFTPNPNYWRGGRISTKTTAMLGKRLQMARHRAANARKHAFLDMVQAASHAKRHQERVEFAEALGAELNPNSRPADVEFYVNRHREAVENQKRISRIG